MNGIVLDLPDTQYHARSELSSTGARLLLDSPARFRWAQDHPQKPKAAFDVGTAAHSKVLGTGSPIAVIPTDLLASNGAVSTKAAKDWVEQARAEGRVPVKAEVAAEVDGMAEAVLAHPRARAVFEQEGHAEASVFGTDPETDVEVRARFDFLAAIPADLKSTAGSSSRAGFEKSAANFGYHVQAEFYLDAHQFATGNDERLPFLFVVVETEPPYLVGVHRLDRDFREIGAYRARKARRIYRECLDTGKWPGHDEEITLAQPPFWLVAEHMTEKNQ